MERGDAFRSAIGFVTPWLHHFSFRPSHVVGMLRQAQDMDRETKKRIIHHERQDNMQSATTVYMEWLKETELTPFLQALRSGTLEHQHVYNILIVTDTYLGVHRDLIHALPRRLQDGTVQLRVLLNLLKSQRLIDHERAEQVLDVASAGDHSEEERHTRIVTFLFTCLYSRQAEVLHETCRKLSTDEPRPLRSANIHGEDEQGASQDSNPAMSRQSAAPDDVPPSSSTSGDSARRVLEHLQRVAPERLAMLAQPGERWPELLTELLSAASEREREWPYALCPLQDLHTLWKTAGELTKSARDDADGDAENDSDSQDSAATVRAKKEIAPDNLCSVRDERTKEFVKRLPNIRPDDASHPDADEIESLVSVETNSQLMGRTAEEGGGKGCGVLREEELRALKSGPIQLWDYQNELLEDVRKGLNVLVWLPTGTGKTYLVLKYAEEHLKNSPDTHVAFVVPKVRLARQQFERFQAYLPEFKPHLKCSETSGTSSGRQPLSEVLETSRVVVLTGQSLVEAVEKEKVRLEDFSLLVLDECHHTRGGHPLRVLMNLYMEAKFLRPQMKLPQVMGLTASPGVGKARGKDPTEAVKYLKQLLARLDVSRIASVRKNIRSLNDFVHPPRTEEHVCEKRERDLLKERLEEFMTEIENNMIVHPDFDKYLQSSPPFVSRVSTEESLLKNLKAPAAHRGEDQYAQWLSNAEKTLKQVNYPKAFYALNAHIEMLKLCQRCLILNEDCDSPGALQLLMEEVDAMRDISPHPDNAPNDVHQQIFDLFNRYLGDSSSSLMKECSKRAFQNPKLRMLEEMLLNSPESDSGKLARDEEERVLYEFSISKQKLLQQAPPAGLTAPSLSDVGLEDPTEGVADPEEEEGDESGSLADTIEPSDSMSVTDRELCHLENDVRGMIFVRTLDLSKALLRWMKGHPKLQKLNPGRITGVNASVKNGGMTKSNVTEVMSRFNNGSIKVVICTSAAEEGLDFQACNFVIRYLYEASMVSMIQIRGRARDKNSRYGVLGKPNMMNKEKENIQSEMAMREAVRNIQEEVEKDPWAHDNIIQKMQREAWNNRWKKDVAERKRLEQCLQPGMYRLMCGMCLVPACTSADIRILRRTNRVVIGAEFCTKYDRRENDPTEDKHYDKKIPRTGKIHCKRCGRYWGILVRSVDDNVEFPVIPIRHFLVDDGNGTKQIEKWSQAFACPRNH
ncbi:ATP-dependent RNA helicase DHX58-like [Babylonia areolata]|uniref:ATP-dependent RNA helicase DHX58-like n=1 Tax=Babylonia areolata TaxID=304850 RepID=UPI003FD3FD2A